MFYAEQLQLFERVADGGGETPCARTSSPDAAMTSTAGYADSPSVTSCEIYLREAERLIDALTDNFKDKFIVRPSLSRTLVSFQGNKSRPVYRWYKFKESFSAALVERLFYTYGIASGRILDPFAGSGTALFAASEMGIDADGIELLPIGCEIIRVKQILRKYFNKEDVEALRWWSVLRPWEEAKGRISLPELRISRGAYPDETKEAIERYLWACEQENDRVRAVLRFALLCILESVSFTRKDGQYLRWDYRSGRTHGRIRFNKGEILNFNKAICGKIEEIVSDLHIYSSEIFKTNRVVGNINIYNNSCIKVLPNLQSNMYDAIITSPPYCNRYDYTRIYALELALLGVDDDALARLRQDMLTCTVENKEKDLLGINTNWISVIELLNNKIELQSIIKYLDECGKYSFLNNRLIPRMVKGYFYEMACVIAECARVLKPNGLMFMVNDNVRYNNLSIPIDLILSSIADKLGFYIENILVLPDEKGNSSQQMRAHGRKALRKCIYVWRKRQTNALTSLTHTCPT